MRAHHSLRSPKFLAALLFGPLAGAAFVLSLGAGACIASAPEPLQRQTDDNGDAGSTNWWETGPLPDASKPDVDNGDPHAVVGANPAHGPFSGGQRVLIQGKGFGSDVRIWFGDTEADPMGMVAIDPTRVQVNAPPGAAGPVDVTAQNGMDESTKRTLPGAYEYDALYALPNSGPIAGGTEIDIYGQGTDWQTDTTDALIDQKPCTDLKVLSTTHLLCTVPKGTPGSKTITVKNTSGTINVLDGYTYEDSDNGYKGGLSGGPLNGKLKVLVYSNFTGDPIPGAMVAVGTGGPGTLLNSVDITGVALFNDPSLTTPKTVTVAAPCSSPISFVDVPVDTVTVYLDPVITPDCGELGDPPPVGGKGGSTGYIQGELVWQGAVEFQKAGWTNVPFPVGPDEKQAAYVFLTTSDPAANFNLPSPAAAVTTDSPGGIGYEFFYYTGPGNKTLYALAGIENRKVSPAKFTAYAMGVVSGIAVVPDGTVENVYIPMNKTIDQVFTMDIAAPVPGPKGPDRLKATVAIMLGNNGFAILPSGQKSPLLPFDGLLKFTYMPALTNELAGATFLSTARAGTGPNYSAPLSVVGRMLSNSTAQNIPVSGFVGVPTLVTPMPNSPWDGRHLAVNFAPGAPIDLTVYQVTSGNGLIQWTIAVPKGANSIELPDLGPIPYGAIPAGPITISIYGARIDAFNYGNLRYRNLRPQGMTAYSLDSFSAFR